MVLTSGINGLLGANGIANLCLHGSGVFHLTTADHSNSHSECSDHSCGSVRQDIPLQDYSAETDDCEKECTDITLKGFDSEPPQRSFFDSDYNQKIAWVYIHSFIEDISIEAIFELSFSPSIEPPPLNSFTELFVRKIVLRI